MLLDPLPLTFASFQASKLIGKILIGTQDHYIYIYVFIYIIYIIYIYYIIYILYIYILYVYYIIYIYYTYYIYIIYIYILIYNIYIYYIYYIIYILYYIYKGPKIVATPVNSQGLSWRKKSFIIIFFPIELAPTPAGRLLEATALWGLIQHPPLEANGVCDQKLQVLLPHRELEAVVPKKLPSILGGNYNDNYMIIIFIYNNK